MSIEFDIVCPKCNEAVGLGEYDNGLFVFDQGVYESESSLAEKFIKKHGLRCGDLVVSRSDGDGFSDVSYVDDVPED